MHVIRDARTSPISRHFCVGKIVGHLQIFFYWPRMREIISKIFNGCVLCVTSKDDNRNLGLYTPLQIPSHLWERISMDFI